MLSARAQSATESGACCTDGCSDGHYCGCSLTAEGGTLVDSGSVGLTGDWKSDTCGRGEKRAEKEILAGDDIVPGAKAGAEARVRVGARAGALMP
jgi:hypothetical protein